MDLEILIEDRSDDITKQRQSGLRVDVEVLLRKVDEVVLGGVAQRVDRLELKNLLLLQELDGAVAERLAQTLVESDRLLLPRFPDRSSPMEYRRLEQHLEGVIQQDQDGIDPAPVPGPVVMLDAEHERVDRLRVEQSGFALHRAGSSFDRHGPSGGQVRSKVPPRAQDSSTGPRNVWSAPASSPASGGPGRRPRRRKARHWTWRSGAARNSRLSTRGSLAGSAVPRRSNVARIARPSTGPSKANADARACTS